MLVIQKIFTSRKQKKWDLSDIQGQANILEKNRAHL